MQLKKITKKAAVFCRLANIKENMGDSVTGAHSGNACNVPYAGLQGFQLQVKNVGRALPDRMLPIGIP